MDSEVTRPPSVGQPGGPTHSPRIVENIFSNDRGLRAGWRLLIYMAIVIGCSIPINVVARHFLGPMSGTPSITAFFFQEISSFILVFGSALIMSRIEKRSPGAYGLPVQGAFGKKFWQGWLLGLVEVSVLIGSIAAFHGYSFGDLAVHGAALFRWGFTWGIFFVFVGLFEEFLFRGYTQFTLSDGVGFWPAAVLLSVGFGAVHLTNPGEGWVGAASVVTIGLVFAFALRRTGNLWLVVGWHASFDFGETFLFSVPNSGLVFDGHLSNAALHGARWLTGGTVGPEGSVFSFVTMGAAAVFIHFVFPAKKTGSPSNAATLLDSQSAL
jgi:uncharacterized protein